MEYHDNRQRVATSTTVTACVARSDKMKLESASVSKDPYERLSKSFRTMTIYLENTHFYPQDSFWQVYFQTAERLWRLETLRQRKEFGDLEIGNRAHIDALVTGNDGSASFDASSPMPVTRSPLTPGSNNLQLPFELLDQIFDNLADQEDLCTCALVCRSWNRAATPKLYAYPKISSPISLTKFLRTFGVIEGVRHADYKGGTRSWLSQYVRELQFLPCKYGSLVDESDTWSNLDMNKSHSVLLRCLVQSRHQRTKAYAESHPRPTGRLVVGETEEHMDKAAIPICPNQVFLRLGKFSMQRPSHNNMDIRQERRDLKLREVLDFRTTIMTEHLPNYSLPHHLSLLSSTSSSLLTHVQDLLSLPLSPTVLMEVIEWCHSQTKSRMVYIHASQMVSTLANSILSEIQYLTTAAQHVVDTYCGVYYQLASKALDIDMTVVMKRVKSDTFCLDTSSGDDAQRERDEELVKVFRVIQILLKQPLNDGYRTLFHSEHDLVDMLMTLNASTHLTPEIMELASSQIANIDGEKFDGMEKKLLDIVTGVVEWQKSMRAVDVLRETIRGSVGKLERLRMKQTWVKRRFDIARMQSTEETIPLLQAAMDE